MAVFQPNDLSGLGRIRHGPGDRLAHGPNRLCTSQVNFITAFVLHHAKLLGSPAMVWAVILLWLADAKGMEMDRHAMRLIEAEIGKLDAEAVQVLRQQLESTSALQN